MIEESYQVASWAEVKPETAPASMDAYMRLAVKIVLQAARDAARGGFHGDMARNWLLSPAASLYLQCLHIHPDAVREWICAGARIPTRGKRGTNIGII